MVLQIRIPLRTVRPPCSSAIYGDLRPGYMRPRPHANPQSRASHNCFNAFLNHVCVLARLFVFIAVEVGWMVDAGRDVAMFWPLKERVFVFFLQFPVSVLRRARVDIIGHPWPGSFLLQI